MLKKILFTVHRLQFTKFAFTLAETLIVMGIIGVVAALTLPNLNSSTGDKEKVAKVKKIYQNLTDAFGRAEAVYGPFDEWCVNYTGSCRMRVLNRISDFIKVTKKCDEVTSCMVFFNNGDNSLGDDSTSVAYLADGTAIGLENCGENTDYTCYIYVDIDGPNKGPNSSGKDTFSFYYNKINGVYVDNIMKNSNSYVNKGSYGYNASSAAAWIINFGNMDYLKTTDGTTCPNNTKLTVGGNHSCK